jgi:methylmalonyl-CoA mutase cobalamin-binding domain/chain
MTHKKISQFLENQQERLAKRVLDKQAEAQPQLKNYYTDLGWKKCIEDTQYNLSYLAESIVMRQPKLFGKYISWLKSVLENRNVPIKDLEGNIQAIRKILLAEFPGDDALALLEDYFDLAFARLREAPAPLSSFISKEKPLGDLAAQYLSAIMLGDRNRSIEIILDAVKDGTEVKDVYLHVFQPVQHEIGRLWETNQISVAQEHYATAVTQLVMSQLYPYIFSSRRNHRTLVATCVGGELHEIGVRMVADFFEMEGWDTFYLGANTPKQSIVSTIMKHEADVVAISATLIVHVKQVRELIHAIRASEVKDIKVLVGGYPFNLAKDLWKKVNADGYAQNAEQAIKITNNFIEE